jgi:hypothetical protein
MTQTSNWLVYNRKADRVEFHLHGITRDQALAAIADREDHAGDIELYEYSGTFRVRVTTTIEEVS